MHIRSDFRALLAKPAREDQHTVTFTFETRDGEATIEARNDGFILIQQGSWADTRLWLNTPSFAAFYNNVRFASGPRIKAHNANVTFKTEGVHTVIRWQQPGEKVEWMKGALFFTEAQLTAFEKVFRAATLWVEAAVRSVKPMPAERKLLVLAVDGLLRHRMITLDCPGSDVPLAEDVELDFDVEDHSISVTAHNIGHGELNIRAEFESGNSGGRKTGKVSVSGWLERKEGVYIMGEGRDGLHKLYLGTQGRYDLDEISLPADAPFAFEGVFFR